MSEHTPGPWAVGYNDGSGIDDDEIDITTEAEYRAHDGMFQGTICTVYKDSDIPSADIEANAHLIAASPALLEACEKVASGLDAADPLAIGHGYEMILAAIALAKGEA